MGKALFAICLIAVTTALPAANSLARDGATVDIVSANAECQFARESAGRAIKTAISEAESLTACLRRSDLADNCSRRFQALNASNGTVEQSVSRVALVCR